MSNNNINSNTSGNTDFIRAFYNTHADGGELIEAAAAETCKEQERLRPFFNGCELPSVDAFADIIKRPGFRENLNKLREKRGFIGTEKEGLEQACAYVVEMYAEALKGNELNAVHHTCDGREYRSFGIVCGHVRFSRDENCGSGFYVQINIHDENRGKIIPAAVPAEAPADVPAVVPTVVSAAACGAAPGVALLPAAETTPESYAADQGFIVLGKSDDEAVSRYMTEFSGQICDICKTHIGRKFIRFLRRRIADESKDACGDKVTFAPGRSEYGNNAENLYSLIYSMQKNGVLASVQINKDCGRVNFIIPECEKVKKFLRGEWLELALLGNVRKIAAKFGKVYDLPVHISRNLQLADPRRSETAVDSELDIVLTIGTVPFVIEAKTGCPNYVRFGNVCENLGVPQGRRMLVNTDLDESALDPVRYFYGDSYRIASAADAEDVMRGMIAAALQEAGYRSVSAAA